MTSTATIALPRRGRGRPSRTANETYQAAVDTFCEAIVEIRSRLDFEVSSRGWCYILEDHGLTKDRFDEAQTNAIVVQPDAGRELCEQAIQKWIGDESAVEQYEESLQPHRDELRTVVAQRFNRG